MKKFAVAFASLSLLFLASCSSGLGSISNSVTPPVQAATYSNASIIGTYSAMFLGSGNGANAIGSFSADGNGHITAGAIVFSDISSTCTGTFTGTYSIQSNASGTASLTFVAPSCATFNYSSTDNYLIEASGGGATFFAQPSPSANQSNQFRIAASKQ
jgi:hypothetical protein